MEPNKFTHDGSMGIVLCTYHVIQNDLFYPLLGGHLAFEKVT